MKIVLIGAGNVATNLGFALGKAKQEILQVYSRTEKAARELAEMLHAGYTTSIQDVSADADLYILSVKDDALPVLIPQLCKGKEDKLFVHTAGSVSKDVFKGCAQHYGVFYPMQTFSKERLVHFDNIPCFVEGSGVMELAFLKLFASLLTRSVYELDSEGRKYLHLAAVFACNFANHCFAVGADILEKHHLPADILLPLIDETAAKVHELPAKDAQTGPAVRYDQTVMKKQADLLEANPLLKEIYEAMSKSIHGMSNS